MAEDDANNNNSLASKLLRRGAREGNLDQVRKALADDTVRVNSTDARGWTALHHACAKNHEAVVRELLLLLPLRNPLATVADVNALTAERSSPLIVCAYNGRPALARLLLEHGADHALRDVHGDSAWDIARARRKGLVVRELEAHGAMSDSHPKRARPTAAAAAAAAGAAGGRTTSSSTDA